MQPYDPFPKPQYVQQFQAPPKQSAIPQVIGILMIIFGSLGLLGGLWNLGVSPAFVDFSDFGHHGAFSGDDGMDVLGKLVTFSRFSSFVGLGIAITELMAGIDLVRYREKGLKLATAYAIANMGVAVISAVIVFAWLQPAMSRNGFGGLLGMATIFGTVISLAWPIVVLTLITRPAAKAACTGF